MGEKSLQKSRRNNLQLYLTPSKAQSILLILWDERSRMNVADLGGIGMSYRYLEDIATADAAFEVEGSNLEELFRDAAIATFDVMVDTKGVEARITREIEMKNEAVDGLLFDWLSELIYLKDADAILFSKFDVNIRRNGDYELKAVASGEDIDHEKHALRSDVKAVTFHQFEIKETGGKWRARVILDI